MTDHKIGTREEWLAARLELLEAEKALTRRSAASTGCGRCGSGWTVRRWAATKATCHGSAGTTSTPRPQGNRRDTRRYRPDTSGGMADAGTCPMTSSSSSTASET